MPGGAYGAPVELYCVVRPASSASRSASAGTAGRITARSAHHRRKSSSDPANDDRADRRDARCRYDSSRPRASAVTGPGENSGQVSASGTSSGASTVTAGSDRSTSARSNGSSSTNATVSSPTSSSSATVRIASAFRPHPSCGLRNRPASGGASRKDPTEAGLRDATDSRIPRAARVSRVDTTAGSTVGAVSSATSGHTVPSRSNTTSLITAASASTGARRRSPASRRSRAC